jgi:tight adherence protein B
MLIGILASLLLGTSVFLIASSLYQAVLSYGHRQMEKRLLELLPAIESEKDRLSIRRFASLSPWLSIAVLVLLLLFARSALAVAISLVAAYFAYKGPTILQRKLKEHQDKELEEQLVDVVAAVANSVKAGETVPVAFKVVASKYDPPTSTVFRTIARRHDNGERFDDALLQVAGALKIESFDYLARAISIHIRRGGAAFEVLNEIRSSLIEQDRCNRVIKATTAAGRFTIKFLTFSPLFVLPLLWFLQPDWIDVLLGNIFGIVLTLLAAGIYLFALRWAEDILSIEKI